MLLPKITHKEKRKEWSRRYYLKHREKILEKQSRWRNSNPDYKTPNHLENVRKFHRSTKGHYKVISANAKKRGITLNITQSEFISWYEDTPKVCVYCDIPADLLERLPKMFGRKMVRLSVDRVDPTKAYQLDNIVLCCLKCNVVKNRIFSFEEMKKLAKKFIKPQWQYLV